MGEYYIRRPDELYHYGVRGMKWGVRHDPERSGDGRARKGMSTAKKIAIGVAVTAAVAGVSYAAIKTYKYNKASHAAVKRILARNSTQNFVRKAANGGRRLTGHSSRLTKAGAASYRGGFYSERAAKAPLTSDYFSNPNTQRRVLEKQANDAWTELGNIQRSSIASGKGVPNRYKRTKITRLTRQKGPRILRVRG